MRPNKFKIIEKKSARLTKKLIEAADRIKLRKLKIDSNPKNRRLRFMYFIEEFDNVLKMFTATKDILSDYPTITSPSTKYDFVKNVVFTFLNSFVDLEAKQCIKESNNDGIVAIELLKAYCARVTPQDAMRCEDSFNNTRQYSNESATKYIARFRDAKLLAKSVGFNPTETKIIDKFLNSMCLGTKYAVTVHAFQAQRRNEEMTPGYWVTKLSMTEIESALLSIDENTEKRSQAHQVNARTNQRSVKNFNKNERKSSPYENSSGVKKAPVCCYCGGDHYRDQCEAYKKKAERERCRS